MAGFWGYPGSYPEGREIRRCDFLSARLRHCARGGCGWGGIPAEEPIPLGVVEKLVRLVGLTGDEIEHSTNEQAVERLNQFWAEQ